MEWKRKTDWGLDPEKKRKKLSMEAPASLKSAPAPYAAGRDSVQGPSMPYAAALQGAGYSRAEPKKETAEREPETSTEQEPAPYLTGRDEVKEPDIPYGAGLQEGGYPKPKAQPTGTEHTAPTKPETDPAPYLAGRDEWKPPAIPYAAGLQGGVEPLPTVQKPAVSRGGTEQDPYIAGRDEVKTGLPYAAGLQAGIKPGSPSKDEQSGHWLKKKAPRRTSQKVLEELETLERSYDEMLQEAEAWESQAALQETPEEMSQWEKKSQNLRKKAAEMEPYLDTLQKEWKYAMDWEWEEEKRKDGYRDPTLWDLTVGSFQQGYDTSALGRESFRDMWGNEDNRKEEYEEKLAGEEYKFMPEGAWERVLSDVSFRIGGEAFKALSPEALTAMGGAAGAAAVAGQLGPQAMLPEEVVTVPAAAIMGHKAGSIATNMEVQAGLAYNEMRENGVSEETARDIAMIIGGLDGALDVIPASSALKYLKILDDSGASKEAIKFFLNQVEKMGVDTRAIIEAALKTEAQEEISKVGVGIGTMLEGKRTPGPEKAKNNDAAPGGENSWISDHTARKLLEDQRMLDYLKRKGDLRLEKNMSLDQKILAVKEATAAIISGQKKYPSDSGVKKRLKGRAKEV